MRINNESAPEMPIDLKRIERITKVYARPEDITLARSFFRLSSPPSGYEGIDRVFIQKVLDFQRMHHLAKKDGILGPATLRAIRRAQEDNTTSLSVNTTENTTEQLRSRTILPTLPQEWQDIFAQAYPQIGSRWLEKIQGGAPLILVNAQTQRGCALMGERFITFPVALWRWWIRRLENSDGMSYLRWSGATGAGIIYRFHDAKIPRDPFADASISWSREEVIGASLFSPEWIAGWGRWWHGVSDTRTPTAGCIGLPVSEVRALAQAVKEYGAWYGYVW